MSLTMGKGSSGRCATFGNEGPIASGEEFRAIHVSGRFLATLSVAENFGDSTLSSPDSAHSLFSNALRDVETPCNVPNVTIRTSSS